MNQLAALLPAGLATLASHYIYAALFVGAFLEGPVVMMTGGFLLRLGQVTFVPLYLSLVLGDFLSDVVWYLAGYALARPFLLRWGSWLGITPDAIAKIEPIFKHYSLRILVISKLTMGFGLATATLATAGMLRVSFVRYAIVNLVCGFMWSFLMLLIGYFFGNVFDFIPSQFQILFVVMMLVAWIWGLRYVARRAASLAITAVDDR